MLHIKYVFKGKSKGSVGNIMTTGLLLIAMMAVMISFMNCVHMLQTKGDVSQIARKYLLVAETEGFLSEGMRQNMTNELIKLGVKEIDLSGTTDSRIGFGETVTVSIRGKIGDKYEISEIRTSTAKY